MIQDKFQVIWESIKQSVKNNFRFATTEMIFVLIFVNVFQMVFGPENSIVGVIFVILMASSMAKDMTLAPVRHFSVQAILLLGMGVAACLVGNLEPEVAVIINFTAAFLILYLFTYEYTSSLYFPYILSYLFLIFISPITIDQLPKRLAGMVTGCVGIIIYQFIRGRNRVVTDTASALLTLIDEADQYVDHLLYGKEITDDLETVRKNLCRLSKIVYGRRKRTLCVSDASFAMVDCGRGLEHLILLLNDMKGTVGPEKEAVLKNVAKQLTAFRIFVEKREKNLIPVDEASFNVEGDKEERDLCHALLYIHKHLLKMTDPETRRVYQKSVLSLSVRLKGALDVSPVRVIYALRVAVLISLCTFLVQKLQLPHGRWFLFTIASVSLPYADDVGIKAKNRFLATVLGGIASVVLYGLIPSPAGRTAVMIVSGYISFYFTKYTQTFACSTIGALGGAVFLNVFGMNGVGSVFLVRLGYICAGILVAYVVNCFIFPFKKKTAARILWKKYENIIELLTAICRVPDEEMDAQLYYELVIQSHLIEERLRENAYAENWEGAKELLEKYRNVVRNAHHKRMVELLTS